MRIFGLIGLVCASVLSAAHAADLSQIGPGASASALISARPPQPEQAIRLSYTANGGESPTFTIQLAKTFISLQRGAQTFIQDYALRRVITLDNAARTFQNSSLYSLIDFLAAETYNRRMERELLKRIQVREGERLMDPFWVQSELHVVEAEDGVPVLDRRTSADGTAHFTYKGTEIASYTPSDQGLSADERAALKKFLLFNTTLHPVIIGDIVQSGKAPRYLSFARPPTQKKPAETWTLQTSSRGAAIYPLTPNFEPVLPKLPAIVSELVPVIMSAREGKAPGRRSIDEYRADIEKSLASNPFQAAVLAFELTLQFGWTLPDYCATSHPCHSLKEVFETARRDPRTDVLLAALQPKTKEALLSAVKGLREMRKDDLSNAYVLDEFLANDLVAARNSDAAVPLLVEAIRGNPYIAGYYHDMGDVFRFSFEPETAWFFYDLGRELPGGADAPVMAGLTQHETELAEKYPQFF